GATATGTNSRAQGQYSTAVGQTAQATGDNSVAMGTGASATNSESTALGAASQAFADSATAVGFGARADQYGATATGTNSRAQGQYSTALGKDAYATAPGSTALGRNAKAEHKSSVALGESAITEAAIGTASVTLNGTKYDFAGIAPRGTVSVGSLGNERTITNVAAGRISGTSTDAINGSQLFATNSAISDLSGTVNDGINFGNGTTANNFQLGDTISVTGDTNLTTETTTEGVQVKLNKDLVGLDSAEIGGVNIKAGEIRTGDTLLNDNGLVFFNGPNNGQPVILTNKGLNNGGNKITKVAAGDAPDDAVNFGQLQATNGKVNDGINFGNGTTANNFQLGDTISVTGDTNLTTETTTEGVQVKLNKDLVGLDSAEIGGVNIKAGEIRTGDTLLNDNGLVFFNGPNNGQPVILTNKGLNNGGNKITKVAAGDAPDDAVNFGQLQATNSNVSNNTTNITNNTTNINKNTTAIENITNGTAGIVRQDPDNGAITVGGQTGGTSVDFSGTDGDRVLTGAADGQVAADSSDVINGSQLFEQGTGVAGIIGGDTVYDPTTGAFTNNDIGGTGKDNINDAIMAVGDAAAAGKNTVSEGSNIVVTETVNAAGSTNYEVATDPDLVVDSVTATDDDGNETALTATGTTITNSDGNTNNSTAAGNTITTVTTVPDSETTVTNVTTVTGSGTNVTNGTNTTDYGANGMTITGAAGTGSTIVNQAGVSFTDSDGKATGPSITAERIDAANTAITNVGPGVNGTDAVNVNQLKDFGYNLSNKIDDVEDDANAGISAAMAMSSIPQSFIPGKSLIGGGIATYNGEGAVAVGLSKVSDNGRWVMKITGTADTQGNAGGAIGAGFHF
ncbi:YadA-like family protein, partial [Psychrobacter sp. Ps7]|uniref:YadA-like family protein n=1 Tax=Psychrobacter sp. Ps7 TaxID=2790961 RepID=UPI001EDF7226